MSRRDGEGAGAELRDAAALLLSGSDAYVVRRFAVAFALVVMSGLLAAVTPIVYKLVVDTLSAREAPSGVLSLSVLLVLYVLGQTLLKAVGSVRQYVHARAEQRLIRHLARHSFWHIMHLPLQFHLDRKTGAIGETLTQGLNGCRILLQHCIYTIGPTAIEFVAIAVVLVHFNRSEYLGILAVASVAYAVAFARAAANVTGPSGEISSAHIDSHAALTDSLLNFETVKYFDAERVVYQRYDEALFRTELAWRSYNVRVALNGLTVSVIFCFSLGAALLLSGRDVMTGAMTVGDFVLINSYVLRLVQPLETVGYAVRDVSQGLSFLKRLVEMHHVKRESTAEVVEQSEAEGTSMEFKNVSFAYDGRRELLKNVSFKVSPGHSVAIVGASGSGKSSLVRLLFRLYEADAGEIFLNDVPIKSLSLSQLRRAIAIVPQDTMLFNDSIYNNIAFGRRDASRAEVEHAAKLAHLHESISRFPNGYETLVGERGLKLSGGEKQRVAIARAVLKGVKIFVFDEATSSLDNKTEHEVLRDLIEISRGRTTLIIAHRLSTVIHANEIIVLSGGCIVNRGCHTELLESSESYAQLWRHQHQRTLNERV